MHTWYHISSPRSVDIVGFVDTVNPHPHRTNAPYWVLVIVEKGQRTVRVDGRNLCAGSHEYLLLPPDSIQEPLENDAHSAFFIHFRADGAPASAPKKTDADRLLLPVCGKLPSGFDTSGFMHYLFRQSLKPYAGKDFCLAQLLALLFALSLHAQLDSIHPHYPAALEEKLLDFIEAHAGKALHAEDYEKAFGLSYHQLNNRFRRQFSFTIKQYHQHMRMRRAAALLLEGHSAQQTARLCGYEDYYFFIHCFKKAHGVSPGRYLRRSGPEA